MIFDYRLNLLFESVNKTIQEGKILKNQKITPAGGQTGIKKSKICIPNVC
jgi:hypothetical protein